MNANKLKAKMVENGHTQSELAHLLGMSANSLSLKMRGKREFTLAEAVQICHALNLDNAEEIVDIFF